MIIGYAITLALSLGLLIAYIVMVKGKEFWLTMMLCVCFLPLYVFVDLKLKGHTSSPVYHLVQ